MKLQEAAALAKPLHDAANRDNDALLIVYFSREEDRYNGSSSNLDAGDALVIIGHLINKFNLSPEVIAAME